VPQQRAPAYYPAQPSTAATYARNDPRATWALVLAVAGVGVGILGVLAGLVVVIFAAGDLTSTYVADAPVLNAFLIGAPALVLGPVAYFMGKTAFTRINESQGKLAGAPSARAAWLIAIAATALGAISTLLWLVILLLAIFGPPPA
jgi:hypothetical protein